MRRILVPLIVLSLLSGCTSWVDSSRASIRGWCENNPDWCSMNAVK